MNHCIPEDLIKYYSMYCFNVVVTQSTISNFVTTNTRNAINWLMFISLLTGQCHSQDLKIRLLGIISTNF